MIILLQLPVCTWCSPFMMDACVQVTNSAAHHVGSVICAWYTTSSSSDIDRGNRLFQRLR